MKYKIVQIIDKGKIRFKVQGEVITQEHNFIFVADVSYWYDIDNSGQLIKSDSYFSYPVLFNTVGEAKKFVRKLKQTEEFKQIIIK